MSAGADLEIAEIAVEVATLSVTSAGSLDASGTCSVVTLAAGSGAELTVRGLRCDNAAAQASAGADFEITAGEVRAVTQSGADVEVWGAMKVEADERSGGGVRVHD